MARRGPASANRGLSRLKERPELVDVFWQVDVGACGAPSALL